MTRAQHQEEQLLRVAAYQDWLHAGMPTGQMPAVPSDADYKAARKAAGDPDSAAPDFRTPRRCDDCPDCGAQRCELVCAPGRFYCAHCNTAGPGPAPLRVGAQLTLEAA